MRYNPNIPTDLVGNKKKEGEVSVMLAVFQTLLRSNFRCGRMLYSRANQMAGRTVMLCLCTGGLCCR